MSIISAKISTQLSKLQRGICNAVGIRRRLQINIIIFLITTFCVNVDLMGQPVQKKVVMISIDGAPDYLIDKFLQNGVLPANGAFAKMRNNGAYAERVFPINVASTGPSHISIFTGLSPARTGIIGNSFRNKSSNWSSPVQTAFRQPIAVETIFHAAMRQGKKVITFGGVGFDNSSEERKANYSHFYPEIDGPSLVIDLIRTDTILTDKNQKVYRKLKADPKSPSAPILKIDRDLKTQLHIYLTDSTNNKTNILSPRPQLIIDTDTILNNGYAASITPNNWTTAAFVSAGKQYNVSFTILREDIIEGRYRLFMSAPAEVAGYPADFVQKVQSSIGLWPGEPENLKQTAGLIAEQIWFEQVDRLAKYSRDLIITGMKEQNWDLLFGYFSTLDDVQHRYTLTDPRQLDYKADNGLRPQIYAGYVEKWFQVIDRYLLEIMEHAPKETNFVIFSDHGMTPIHTSLLLNNFFEKEGFKFSQSELKSISSGTSAHIYINKEKITDQLLPTYINNLSKRLKSMLDPLTGEPIFELVANQDEQKAYDLFHKDFSGDLFVSCKPGYSISDRYQPEVSYLVQNSFDPIMFNSQNQPTKNFLTNGTMNETGRAVHGGLSSVRELQSIFYAIGPDVPKKKLGSILSIQIASTVAKLLNIKPPKDTDQKSVF